MKRILSTLIALTSLSGCSSTDIAFTEEGWRRKADSSDTKLLYAPNTKDGSFYNPWMAKPDYSFFTMLRWRFSSSPDFTDEEINSLPDVEKDSLKIIAALNGGDFIMWIGHNTFLIRTGGIYWLTDPIFSERALIIKRKTPPGIQASELSSLVGSSPLNVVISHNHYDHLDEESVISIPRHTRFYVPSGMGTLLKEWGLKNIHEMNWWDETDTGSGYRLTALPAQHWSRRIGRDTNASLWSSFMLDGGGYKIYLGGDSGYFIGYREFGIKFPGIDYALLPVTAYTPRWFMHYNHMNADEALDAFNELGAREFIPTQWGTFKLADEPAGFPGIDLKRKIALRHLNPNRFHIMNIGSILPIKP